MFRKYFIVSAIIALGLVWVGWRMLSAPETPGQAVDFVITSGQDVKTIGRNLLQEHLIRSRFAFETYIWWLKADHRVQAGSYNVSTGYNLFQLVDGLLSGEAARERRLTFIEGWDLKDYRDYLVKRGFDGREFDRLTSSADTWRQNYTFLSSAPADSSLEGYLFPDTYSVVPEASVSDIIEKLLDNFGRRVSPDLSLLADERGYKLHEIITLASIVENEVATEVDRKIVADVFYKRLRDKIPLQSDATINYLTGSGRARSTVADLAVDSPYNTYKNNGLPPGPISNPGLESILAALRPTPNDYYYFLTDTKGKVYYARTFEEHQANRVLYLN